MTLSIEACQQHKNGVDYLLRVREEPGWLAKLFGARPRTRRFMGRGTVWREVPGYRRPGRFYEYELAELWDKWWYEQQESE